MVYHRYLAIKFKARNLEVKRREKYKILYSTERTTIKHVTKNKHKRIAEGEEQWTTM